MRDKLIRVPNTECWVDQISVVCVARKPDVEQKTSGTEKDVQTITMVCFEIRLIDGKVLTVKHHDRIAMAKFLHEIGVDWDSASG